MCAVDQGIVFHLEWTDMELGLKETIQIRHDHLATNQHQRRLHTMRFDFETLFSVISKVVLRLNRPAKFLGNFGIDHSSPCEFLKRFFVFDTA